jgi:hypothetical protein
MMLFRGVQAVSLGIVGKFVDRIFDGSGLLLHVRLGLREAPSAHDRGVSGRS